jgi:hypothetical protein
MCGSNARHLPSPVSDHFRSVIELFPDSSGRYSPTTSFTSFAPSVHSATHLPIGTTMTDDGVRNAQGQNVNGSDTGWQVRSMKSL